MTVDAYPQVKFKGHVDSIQSGTGPRFSLLPPENATGNYVKVVQRVPVKIVLDDAAANITCSAPGCPSCPKCASNNFNLQDFTAMNANDPQPKINPWMITLAVMLATFMEVLDTSIANVSLKHIAGSLSVSTDESTWVLTTYLISNAIIIPSTAWFGQRFGRKTFPDVLRGRLHQRFLSVRSGHQPADVAGDADRSRGRRRRVAADRPVHHAGEFSQGKTRQAMGVYGIGVVTAPILGPVLGGWITDNLQLALDFLHQCSGGAAGAVC